ncbi:MAG TPA: hypothetical protein VK993_05820, partial [Chthoniobacterales bacterium]|nr:hypothetical protein [Chthoniobacterales bacterium]
METPRIESKAQPEIEFAGAGIVLPARHAPSDPAVTAAFIAFHRNTGSIGTSAQRRGYVSRGGLVLGLLTILGFGGGLFLAVFSFNSTEQTSSTAAARPPEMLCMAPAATEAVAEPSESPSYAVTDEAGLHALPSFDLPPHDQAPAEISLWRTTKGGHFASFGNNPNTSADAPAFAGVDSPMPGSNATNDLESDSITGAFGA